MIITKEDNLFFIVTALILLGVFILSIRIRDYSSRMLGKTYANVRVDERSCFILGISFSLIWFIGRHISNSPEVDATIDGFLLPSILSWMLFVTCVVGKACNGYKFQNGELVFRRMFAKKTVGKDDVRNIILSTARGRYSRFGKPSKKSWCKTIWPNPFITLESAETTQLLYTPRPGLWEVSHQEAKEWSKEYNHYIYGFLYDPNNPPDCLFENYTGKIYISYSLLSMYCDEFFAFLEKNNIRKDQVSIIKDKTTYEEFPREVDEAYVDKRIQEFFGKES